MKNSKEKQFRECPYCKEEIFSSAIKCKHCKSSIQPDKPSHNGICPYCKENIKPEAIKCKHCESFVVWRSISMSRSREYPLMNKHSDPCCD